MAGYTFEGWFTAENGGSKIEGTHEVQITADTTYYAHWRANVICLTLSNGFDGEISNTLDGDKERAATETPGTHYVYFTYNVDTYYTGYNYQTGEFSGELTTGKIVPPQLRGHTFDGYFTNDLTPVQYILANGGFTSNPYIAITEDTTLYAHWTVDTYWVTFNANGGEIDTNNILTNGQKEVTYASTYGALPTATLSGVQNIGWFTAPYNGVEITASTVVTDAADGQVLYAHYPTKVEVDYDGNLYYFPDFATAVTFVNTETND